jgi:predicted GH43/DUF377 family glycosyl hydrolase
MKSISTIFVFVLLIASTSSSIAQINWTKYEDNPILVPGSSGTWNDYSLFPGCILFDGSTYHFWYGGHDGSKVRIGYATSPDGEIWTPYAGNPVMDVGLAGSWEDERVGVSHVLFDGNIYHMWYTGFDGTTNRIGYATSTDRTTWTKYEGNPIMGPGPAGSWSSREVGANCIFYSDSTYHMWYDGVNAAYNISIGYAISTDGINWTSYAGNPVLTPDTGKWDGSRVDGADVFFDGKTYHMWYTGASVTSWWQWQIGYATSSDGITWTKYGSNPILTPDAGKWDSQFVGYSRVLLDTVTSQYKMWYGGSNGDWYGKLGYATAPLTINVPDDFETIQAAIDAAHDGNVVLVDEGTYYENINFKGKAITVASLFYMDGDTSHISKTIINGSQHADPDSGSVVNFISGEDTTSILCGFTITGGSGTYDSGFEGYGGGGILMFLSGGKVINNKIINNHIEYQNLTAGAGLLFVTINTVHNIIIEHNEFKYNSVTSHSIIASGGGGIYCLWRTSNGYARIRNNHISFNSVTNTGSYKAIAGGLGLSIYLPSSVNIVVENNTISNNELHCVASIGAGIYIVYWELGGVITDNYPSPIISNNIVYDNYSEDRGAGIGIWTVEKNHQASSVITPQPVIINNTIVNNKANDGSGIFNFDSYPLLMNNIFWDDLSVEGSREIFNDDIDYPDYPDKINGGELHVYYSDIQGGWEGWENFEADPMFSDALFHFSEGSPCIDAGHDSSFFNDIEDEGSAGSAKWPAMGTLRNDQGVYGGPQEYDVINLKDVTDLILDIPDKSISIPLKFRLSHNYPNPFNPSTKIKYSLPAPEIVKIEVYNLLGQKIKRLLNQQMPAGYHEYEPIYFAFNNSLYHVCKSKRTMGDFK